MPTRSACVRACGLALALVGWGSTLRAAEIAVLPTEVSLQGADDEHQLLVQHRAADDFAEQITAGVVWRSSNPEIVAVDDGVARAVSDGQATIEAQVGEAVARAMVTVRGVDSPRVWSFRNDVQPVLAKAGCNSGACHGALAGKGGFKLSLRGYDTHTDYFNITRQARGRRVELAEPGRSLLLAKPSGALPHKGGLRFETDSREYHVLAQWIAAGAPAPTAEDARIDRLEVLPDVTLLQPGDAQQMLVRAHYDDGRVRDVTRWAKFSSANETIATVDEAGRVTVIGHGEGAITAWFDSKIVIARVTSPYPYEVPAEVYAAEPRHNFVDELVLEQLARLHLRPSPLAGDEQFIRRAFIDTIGTLPTADEVRRFLADTQPDKRNRLIDDLLARPEFVDYWTYKWSDMLLINGQLLRPEAVKAYYHWVRGHVAANTPWDQFVREIVTSQGSSFENGATNFYALHQDPEGMTENVAQAFLGLSIGCAKCHNHPLEKWTNNQYYAMANMFSRVRAKGWGGDPRGGDGKRTLYVVSRGELIQPLTGKPQPPTPLDGEPLEFDDPTDRRIALANWLTAPDNPYFARSITNRVWANFFGVGLVEAVDDMRVSNPASNEKLLAAAAQYLIDNEFDLKQLMRVILRSRTYQRSSEPLPENQDEQRFYSRYYPRRLMAEVMLDGISQVIAAPTSFTEIAFPGADTAKTDFYPAGTRALQLYDSAVASYFLEAFGRNQRMITCECERSNEPSLVQVLHISNGATINEKLKAADNRVDQLLASSQSDEQIIDEVYLHALARRPTDSERQQLLAIMGQAGDAERRQVVEDLFWSVLSSREFLFNH